MTKSGVAVLAWAAWLSLLSIVLSVWTSDDLSRALLAGAAVAAWVLGAWLAVRRRLRKELWRIPDLSLATVLLALGVTTAANGAIFGLWLILIGVGIVVVALAALARELGAERRAR